MRTSTCASTCAIIFCASTVLARANDQHFFKLFNFKLEINTDEDDEVIMSEFIKKLQS